MNAKLYCLYDLYIVFVNVEQEFEEIMARIPVTALPGPHSLRRDCRACVDGPGMTTARSP